MKKVVLLAMLLGFVVATSIGLCSLYSYRHGDTTPASNLVSTITLWVWPTGLYLIETSDNATGYVMFALSAVANGILYGLIAFGAALLWKYVFAPKADANGHRAGGRAIDATSSRMDLFK